MPLLRPKKLLELRVEQRTAVLTRVNHELRTRDRGGVKRAEQQLKTSLDQLRASLPPVSRAIREEERTSISREIHDETRAGLAPQSRWILR